jgi:hypothetical protein
MSIVSRYGMGLGVVSFFLGLDYIMAWFGYPIPLCLVSGWDSRSASEEELGREKGREVKGAGPELALSQYTRPLAVGYYTRPLVSMFILMQT